MLTIIFISATAHPATQVGILEQTYIPHKDAYAIGGEAIGWAAHETHHIGKVEFQYQIWVSPFVDEDVAESIKANIRSGVALWSQVATITEIECDDDAQVVSFVIDNLSEAGYAAATSPINLDESTGHTDHWQILVNAYCSITPNDIAHEIGHVIGLFDLHESTNQDKLMYWKGPLTATAPTESDLWGAKVILGIHVNHEFSKYRYWGLDRYGNPQHNAYCTFCNGNSVVISACVIAGPNGECLYCDA